MELVKFKVEVINDHINLEISKIQSNNSFFESKTTEEKILLIFTLSEKDFVYSIVESQSIIITIDTKYFTKYNEPLTIFQKKKQKIPIDIQHNLLQIIKNNSNDIFRKIGIESLILDSICKLGTNELQLQEDNQKVKFSGLANVEKINLARKFIVEHLSEHLTIPIIALEVGTNQSYLKIGFKKMYGQTIFEFIQSTRMQTAKELLKKTDLTITIIAYKVGYSSLSSFSQTYKKHFGITPSLDCK